MKRFLLILLILPFLSVSAYAEGTPFPLSEELNTSAVKDSLPEDVQKIGGELRYAGDYDGTGALERLWNRFLLQIIESLHSSAREMFSVMTLVILCALGTCLSPGQKQSEMIQIAGCAACSCLIAGGMNSLVGRAVNALTSLSDYAKAALPAIYSAAAAGGAPTSASARYAASCLALDLMMSASQHLLIPVMYAAIAMTVCAGIFDHPLLRGMLRTGKKLATLLLSALTLGFTTFLSVTGIVTGSADEATVKAARTVMSAAIPVVGKILSDAASSVVSAASVIRNTAGAFGLVSVCALCSAPFAAFGVRKLLFSLAAAATEMTGLERLSRLLGEFSSLMALLLGLVGAYGLMLFVSIVSAIRTVTG